MWKSGSEQFGFAALVLGALIVAWGFLKPPSEGIWEETLWQAEASGLDYEAAFRSARTGDRAALGKLLAFSARADAAGGLGHGVALIAVLKSIGDPDFASAVRGQPGQLRMTIRRSLEAGLAYAPGGLDPTNLSGLFPETSRATLEP